MGRRAVPTHLKIVAGNPGRRPLNMKEPKPERGIPTCPEHLSDVAKEEWARVSIQLDGIGVLTKLDQAALAAYCQCWADWVEAETAIAKYGKLIKSAVNTKTTRKQGSGDSVTETTGGNFIHSPYLAMRNRALEMMHKFLLEFGMTPSARSRISVDHEALKEDPANKYFAT